MDRVQFLEQWVQDNPLATIDEAREAVKEKFGISVGNKLISDALRNARKSWEEQRRASRQTPGLAAVPDLPAPVPVPVAIQAPVVVSGPVTQIVVLMKASGIRGIEILDDGKVQVQFIS